MLGNTSRREVGLDVLCEPAEAGRHRQHAQQGQPRALRIAIEDPGLFALSLLKSSPPEAAREDQRPPRLRRVRGFAEREPADARRPAARDRSGRRHARRQRRRPLYRSRRRPAAASPPRAPQPALVGSSGDERHQHRRATRHGTRTFEVTEPPEACARTARSGIEDGRHPAPHEPRSHGRRIAEAAAQGDQDHGAAIASHQRHGVVRERGSPSTSGAKAATSTGAR